MQISIHYIVSSFPLKQMLHGQPNLHLSFEGILKSAFEVRYLDLSNHEINIAREEYALTVNMVLQGRYLLYKPK